MTPQASLKLLVISLFVSCSTVDSSKYIKLSTTVNDLNSKIDEVTIISESVARDGEIRALSSKPDAKLGPYYITSKDDIWSMASTPLYMEFRTARVELSALNSIFEEYLKLLVELAGGNVKERAELMSAGKKLNTESAALKKNFEIITPIAISAFESFVDKKRGKYLRKAIKENQAAVLNFARLSTELIDLQLQILRRSYSNAFTGISKDWKNGNKKVLARELLNLNDSFIAGHESLKSMKANYKTLIKVHMELSQKNESQGFSTNIKALTREINRFSAIQKELKKD